MMSLHTYRKWLRSKLDDAGVPDPVPIRTTEGFYDGMGGAFLPVTFWLGIFVELIEDGLLKPQRSEYECGFTTTQHGVHPSAISAAVGGDVAEESQLTRISVVESADAIRRYGSGPSLPGTSVRSTDTTAAGRTAVGKTLVRLYFPRTADGARAAATCSQRLAFPECAARDDASRDVCDGDVSVAAVTSAGMYMNPDGACHERITGGKTKTGSGVTMTMCSRHLTHVYHSRRACFVVGIYEGSDDRLSILRHFEQAGLFSQTSAMCNRVFEMADGALVHYCPEYNMDSKAAEALSGGNCACLGRTPCVECNMDRPRMAAAIGSVPFCCEREVGARVTYTYHRYISHIYIYHTYIYHIYVIYMSYMPNIYHIYHIYISYIYERLTSS